MAQDVEQALLRRDVEHSLHPAAAEGVLTLAPVPPQVAQSL
jgi:hypothetical protein